MLQIRVDKVIDEAVLLLNSSAWRRDHFIEGLYQTSDTIGTHYELYFVNDKNNKKRVTLFQPDTPPIAISHTNVDHAQKLNIIVPLMGRLDSFKLFLDYFETILTTSATKLYLTVVYFGDSINILSLMFQSFVLKRKYRLHHIEHVKDRNFSRGYALDVGIRAWKARDDPIIFLCDVDVLFTSSFIDRCLSYPKRKERVFYPVVFSLYNPKVCILLFAT